MSAKTFYKEKMNPDTLREICYHTVREEFRKDFTEVELVQLKEQHFQIGNVVFKRGDLVKKFTALINSDMEVSEILGALNDYDEWRNIGDKSLKTMKAEWSESIEKINRGYEIKNEKVYGMDYQDEGYMVYYDESGHYVKHRPLKREERQTTIHSISKSS